MAMSSYLEQELSLLSEQEKMKEYLPCNDKEPKVGTLLLSQMLLLLFFRVLWPWLILLLFANAGILLSLVVVRWLSGKCFLLLLLLLLLFMLQNCFCFVIWSGIPGIPLEEEFVRFVTNKSCSFFSFFWQNSRTEKREGGGKENENEKSKLPA